LRSFLFSRLRFFLISIFSLSGWSGSLRHALVVCKWLARLRLGGVLATSTLDSACLGGPTSARPKAVAAGASKIARIVFHLFYLVAREEDGRLDQVPMKRA
jgi:hypothetical protein